MGIIDAAGRGLPPLVFDAPPALFEALVVDNLDIGRPDKVGRIVTGPPHRGRPGTAAMCRAAELVELPAVAHKLDCVPKTSIVSRVHVMKVWPCGVTLPGWRQFA